MKTQRKLKIYLLNNLIHSLDRSKAAADGCVIWAAKLAVVGRHTRVAYGTTVRTRYNPKDPEHEGRKVTRGHAGYDGVAGRWSEIIDAVRQLVGNGSCD